jgi:hypothetical protein
MTPSDAAIIIAIEDWLLAGHPSAAARELAKMPVDPALLRYHKGCNRLSDNQPQAVPRLRPVDASGSAAPRRWRVSLAGRRTMSTAIKLREVAYPALFAATA